MNRATGIAVGLIMILTLIEQPSLRAAIDAQIAPANNEKQIPVKATNDAKLKTTTVKGLKTKDSLASFLKQSPLSKPTQEVIKTSAPKKSEPKRFIPSGPNSEISSNEDDNHPLSLPTSESNSENSSS